ncbi:MAG: response regulator [Limisphaerales bacterium]
MNHQTPPRMRLLLVDPEHDYFAQMMFLLDEIAPRRFVLEWASTYAFAVGMLRRQQFDLCFVNVRMGHRNGTDLLLDMQALGRTAPVILLARGEDLAEPGSGRAVDQLDRNRLSTEILRRALRDVGLRPASLTPLAIPVVPTAQAVPVPV